MGGQILKFQGGLISKLEVNFFFFGDKSNGNFKKSGEAHNPPRPSLAPPVPTTHSLNFLGLHQGFGIWKESNFGKGVIIRVLDTGVWPDHPSCSDDGMPPPPAKIQINRLTNKFKLIKFKLINSIN